MSGDVNLRIVITAANQTSSVFRGIASDGLSAGSVLRGVGGIATAGLGLATGAAIAFGAASVKSFGNFQQAMIKSQAEAGLTKQQMLDMGNSVLKMAPQVGKMPVDLAKGLFFVESAGFSGKAALDTLRISAQMASADMTDTATVTKGLTAATKAFGYATTDSQFVANQMAVTVSRGKMTMADYAQVIGTTAQTSRAYHVSMTDTNAALDTLTNNGFPSAQRAGTAFSNLLVVMDGATGTVAKRMKALHLSFDETKFKAMPLTEQIGYLKNALKGHDDQIQYVLRGNKNAMMAFKALGDNTKEFTGDVNALNDAQKNGGAQAQGFAATQQGVNFKMAQGAAAMEVFRIKVGEQLVNAFGKVQSAASPLIGQVVDWANKNHIVEKSIDAVSGALVWVLTSGPRIQGVIKDINGRVQDAQHWFDTWRPVIQNTGIALTVFFLPAIISSGVQAGIAGATIAIQFIGSMIATGVQAVINAAKVTVSFVGSMITAGVQGYISAGKLAIFIGSMITSGAQAVINGAKVVASFVGSMITAGVQSALVSARVIVGFVASMIASGTAATINAAKIVGSFVLSLITTGAQAVVTGGMMLASLVPAIISVGTEAVVTAAVAIPGMIVGFGAWTAAAGAAAIATIAATWPVLAIIAAVALLGVGIYLLVTHWKQVTQFLQSAWQGFTSWFQNSLGQVGASIGNFGNSIRGWFANLAGQASAWGSGLIQHFISGILGMVGAVGNAAGQIMGKVAAFLKPGSPTKEGVGRTLMAWGPNLVKNFAQTMASATPQARASAENMMRQVRDAINTDTMKLDMSKLSGNKAQTKELSKQLSLLHAQMDAYKRIIAADGYTYSAKNVKNPIDFTHHATKKKAPTKYSQDGYGPVYASGSGASVGSSANSSGGGYGSSGATTVIINNTFNFTPSHGTTQQEAEEMYQYFKKRQTKDVRVLGTYTNSSSGAA